MCSWRWVEFWCDRKRERRNKMQCMSPFPRFLSHVNVKVILSHCMSMCLQFSFIKYITILLGVWWSLLTLICLCFVFVWTLNYFMSWCLGAFHLFRIRFNACFLSFFSYLTLFDVLFCLLVIYIVQFLLLLLNLLIFYILLLCLVIM